MPVNLPHLEARIIQSERRQTAPFDTASLQVLLRDRIQSIDMAAAAEDVRPFLRDPRELQLWNEEFFMQLIPLLQASESCYGREAAGLYA